MRSPDAATIISRRSTREGIETLRMTCVAKTDAGGGGVSGIVLSA